ncbi:MarR family winged helix-turn-helix transcriptional regulator [Kitasatospora viridis]|uniref:DNA-binding MarR family transcriptional regulator n=1 Tax=Kitasatospora viridis TaxID=281105 RepID=A0A561T738_9ACTN|nr:MarR family transcriptional regulator [Kitasatospora viridis]TWF82912.1 DNA-binding MarR family transcriptional regulator [Kitasatospora viridis]
MAYKSSGAAAAPRAFFDHLVRTETRIYNALNDHLREHHAIVTSQFEFLDYLRRHPAARVADLAAEFAIGVGATSKGVDRLERQGWVARQPNPADRRSSLLVLTEEGERLVEAAGRSFDERLAELLGEALDGDQLAAGTELLGLLRAALERTQTGVPTG